MRPRRWLSTLSKLGCTLSAAPNFAYELCVARGGEPEGLPLDRWRAALDGAEPVHAATTRIEFEQAMQACETRLWRFFQAGPPVSGRTLCCRSEGVMRTV